MTAEACREWRERLGAYVLGQLPEKERAATSAHVDGCAACRAEVESLTPLAELLPKADPARVAAAPAPPAELADRIAARISREGRGRQRRRRRRRLAVGLSSAVAAVAAAALLLALLPSSPEPDTGARRVDFDSLPKGVRIAATLQPQPFGTEIRVDVRGMRYGTLCRVFLRRSDGTAMGAGSFHYRYSGDEQAVLTSALDLSAARAIVVRAGGRTYIAPLRDGMRAPEAQLEPHNYREGKS